MVPREETLAATWAAVAALLETARSDDLGPNDVLLVPGVFVNLTHHFQELEGKRLLNPSLRQQQIDVAQPDIFFRLDRSGAELRAESKLYMCPAPNYYVEGA